MYLNCVSAYVSTEDNNDIVNIKATAYNCIVDAHLTKLAISIFLGKIEGSQRFYSHFFQENFHNFVIFRPILMKISLKD